MRQTPTIDVARAAQAALRGRLPDAEAWEILGAHVPETPPPGWQSVVVQDDGVMYANRRTGQTVIASVQREPDGRRWLHVSTAFPARMPTYEELAFVKRHWIGAAHRAIEVHAPEAEHVNIHPFARHLWHCADGDGLPDFSHGAGTI